MLACSRQFVINKVHQSCIIALIGKISLKSQIFSFQIMEAFKPHTCKFFAKNIIIFNQTMTLKTAIFVICEFSFLILG